MTNQEFADAALTFTINLAASAASLLVASLLVCIVAIIGVRIVRSFHHD